MKRRGFVTTAVALALTLAVLAVLGAREEAPRSDPGELAAPLPIAPRQPTTSSGPTPTV
ncbi:MAG: polysaccharide deacetylase, partial [Saccharothrix sp.]|nr:polysaccharide deacetylase [Saccharothrix sp.]